MNKLKSDLVSIVGHEFRTALTGIQGFSEMMRDGEFSAEEMREFGGYINTDARRLSRMINDMLDLERMELGKMALRLDKVELNDVLKEVVEHVRSSTSLHTFRFQLDNALPSIIGDRDKLVQVVTNLVTNAIKYSPQGGDICICSTLEDDCVHVQVQDQGVGIPADYLEHVFERYCRIEAGSTRYIKGTGLGLPIVRQIVQMHGGKTWAESVQGSGSIFHVTLPLAVVPVEAK